MSIKKIILFVVIFLVVIASTVGLLFVLNIGKSTSLPRGIKPTDTYAFNKVNNVSSLPVFSELPAETGGWKKTTSTSERTYSNTQLTDDNSCTINISSQLLPNAQKDVKDYQLSRSLIETTALSEEGSATDPYIVSVKSTSGDVDLYSALYNPKLQLMHSSGTTPTNVGGSKKREGTFTTFIAVRVFGSQIQVGDSTKESTTTKGVVSLGAMLPAVIVNYTCPSNHFNVYDVLRLLKQVKIDFTKTSQIIPPTTGK